MWMVCALGGIGWAVEPAPVSSADFRSYLDQARFFLRKEWYDDAREQLELAVSTEDGKLDAEAWFLLAKVRYELGDLQGARFAADRALVHSQDDEQARQTHELLTWLDQKFGYVTLDAPYDGVRAIVEVELQSTIFDPELKVWLTHLQARLDEPVLLPRELGLPAGTYLIDGVTVEVTPGSHQVVQGRGAGQGLGSSAQVELAVGANGFVGRRLSHLLPAPTIELSGGIPLGFLQVGASASWIPQWFTPSSGPVTGQPGGWAAGLRAGVEVPGIRPLVLRPSLTARVGQIPSLELGCVDADGWTCGRDVPDAQLSVYTAGFDQRFGVELYAGYADRSRSSGLGAGLKVNGDWVVGALPRRGTAVAPFGPFPFTVDGPRGWTGGSWRVAGVATWEFRRTESED